VSERAHPDPNPRDDTDAVKDIARDLAEFAAQIFSFKSEANAYLVDPNYNAFQLRLERAHAAVEAAAVEARRRGCTSTRATRITRKLRGGAMPDALRTYSWGYTEDLRG
jgi:hypothetical protein